MLPILVAMAWLGLQGAAPEEPTLTFHAALKPQGATPPAGYVRLRSLDAGSATLDVRSEAITAALPLCYTVTAASETVLGEESFELTLQIGNGEAAPLLAWTEEHVGSQLALVFDGIVVSSPVVQGPIRGRVGHIVGDAELGAMVRKRLPSVGAC